MRKKGGPDFKCLWKKHTLAMIEATITHLKLSTTIYPLTVILYHGYINGVCEVMQYPYQYMDNISFKFS